MNDADNQIWSKWIINQLHIKYDHMHRFLGKDAKSEEYDINMRRNDVYDDIWWEYVFRAGVIFITDFVTFVSRPCGPIFENRRIVSKLRQHNLYGSFCWLHHQSCPNSQPLNNQPGTVTIFIHKLLNLHLQISLYTIIYSEVLDASSDTVHRRRISQLSDDVMEIKLRGFVLVISLIHYHYN